MICNKCFGSKKLNIAIKPNECLDQCPQGTHESIGRCIKGDHYVQLRFETKYYNGQNPDIINEAYKGLFD